MVNRDEVIAYMLYGWVVAAPEVFMDRGILMVFPEGSTESAPPEPSQELRDKLRGCVWWTNQSQTKANS
jgi:hypothetical protein